MTLILVIDDETGIREFLRAMLADEGYETTLAGDGQEGLQRLEEALPDVVLSDVMMPFLNGIDLAMAIARNPRYRTIPVVLMSAVGRSVVTAGTPHAAYLPKPFDIGALLTTLEQVLEARRHGAQE